jgi:DNA mismatch repair ATPase MutS
VLCGVGVDADYDAGKADITRIQEELEQHLRDMRRQTGLNDLKYWGNNKDRYQIEVDINKCNRIPSSWTTKSQKKTHRRYRTDVIEEKLIELQEAEDRVEVAQKDTLRKIFGKFDDHSHVWLDALTCMSTLDALLAMAQVSASPNYVWPVFLAPTMSNHTTSGGSYVPPTLEVTEGRHPMLEHVFTQRCVHIEIVTVYI